MKLNKIASQLSTWAKLAELHNGDKFKVRAIESATEAIEGLTPVSLLDIDYLATLKGVGKKMAEAIVQLASGTKPVELSDLIDKTPPKLLELFNVRGLGVKKIQTLWLEHHITSAEMLFDACNNGLIEKIKGFGAKSQEAIINELRFYFDARNKLLLPEAEDLAHQLSELLIGTFPDSLIKVVGDVAMLNAVVTEISIVVAAEAPNVLKLILATEWLTYIPNKSGLYSIRGVFANTHKPFAIHCVKANGYHSSVLYHSAPDYYLSEVHPNGNSLLKVINGNPNLDSQHDYYAQLGINYEPPIIRNSPANVRAKYRSEGQLTIEASDILGVIHAHTTYSDGANTIAEMAEACIDMGYKYLGITDHSKSAFYANGLNEDRIAQQQTEIDKLNKQFTDFKILKGIESDILPDGSLDYDESILKTFDFVIGSIHSGFEMDKIEATNRLIKAIENPYLNIVGHPTGRLLLRRNGYPVDMHKVIDACAANGKFIEINSNPYRLDLDIQYFDYALNKGVKLLINPDAHSILGISDVRYGLILAQKMGLNSENILNCLPVNLFLLSFK